MAKIPLARDHDFRCELGAGGLFTVGAEDPGVDEVEGSGNEYNQNHCISQVDMDAKCSVERHEAVQNRLGERRDGEARHG